MKAAVFRSISRPVFSVKINVWKSWHFREGCHVVPTIRVGDAINISMCGKIMRYIRSKHFSALYWKRTIWNGLKFERKKKIPRPNWSFWNNQMKQQMSEDNEKQTAKNKNKTKNQKTKKQPETLLIFIVIMLEKLNDAVWLQWKTTTKNPTYFVRIMLE